MQKSLSLPYPNIRVAPPRSLSSSSKDKLDDPYEVRGAAGWSKNERTLSFIVGGTLIALAAVIRFWGISWPDSVVCVGDPDHDDLARARDDATRSR
jgi:hypothetical protein